MANKEDVVNHPEHYASGAIECIDAIQASMTYVEFIGYLKGNCIKYLWRYRTKANGSKAIEDLQKAQWYLRKLETTIKTSVTIDIPGGNHE